MGPLQKIVSICRSSPERNLDGVITLTLLLTEEGQRWVGECLELGTAAYGHSLEEVHEQLIEAVLLQLNEMERMGFIEDYLREHNVRLQPLTEPTGKDRWSLVGSAS